MCLFVYAPTTATQVVSACLCRKNRWRTINVEVMGMGSRTKAALCLRAGHTIAWTLCALHPVPSYGFSQPPLLTCRL